MRRTNASLLVNKEWDGVITMGVANFPFRPIVDGTLLPDGPHRLLSKGHFKQTPILLGANSDEGVYFIIYYLTEVFKLNDKVSY